MSLSVAVDAGVGREDAETAREITELAYEKSTERLPKDGHLTVELGWSEADFVLEQMGGVAGWTHSAERIAIDFNAAVEGWEDSLRASVAHEFAHATFFERLGRDELDATWEYLLFEAQSQNFAAAVYPEISAPWRDHVDGETLERWWPEIRDERLDDGEEAGAELFFGSDEVPHWLGYTLSYRLGGRLLEGHEIGEFPELSKADVVAAGDALFG